MRLHQTVALIDSKTFASKLKSNASVVVEEGEQPESKFTESDLLIRQIIYADKILLNKVDLIAGDGGGMIEEIREIVGKVNPEA